MLNKMSFPKMKSSPLVFQVSNKTRTLNNNCTVSFGNVLDKDVFQPQVTVLDGKLSVDKVKDIINQIENQADNANKGSNSNFYKIGEYGVKTKRAGQPEYNNDKDYAKEAFILEYLEKMGIEGIPKLKARAKIGDKYYLITDFIKGKGVSYESGTRLTPETIRSIIDTFHSLDRQSFIHYDLNGDNILLDGNKANIIDFNSFDILGTLGSYIKPENRDISNFKKLSFTDPEQVNKGLSERVRFDDVTHSWYFYDNPYFLSYSNLVNFESRCLSKYLDKFSENDPEGSEKFFVDYLKERSNYHIKNAEFLKELSAYTDAPRVFDKATEHELASAAVLKNPNDDVAFIERQKMRVKDMLFDKCYGGKKDPAFIIEIRQTYDSLMDKLKISDRTEPNMKIYLENNLTSMTKLASYSF